MNTGGIRCGHAGRRKEELILTSAFENVFPEEVTFD